MNTQEKIMLVLYIIAIGSILLLFQFWAVGIIILIVLLILLMQKMHTDKRISEVDKNREEFIEKISNGLDSFSRGLQEIKLDISRIFYAVEKKFEDERRNNEKAIEKHYSDLAKKMIDIENRLNEVKRWLGKE